MSRNQKSRNRREQKAVRERMERTGEKYMTALRVVRSRQDKMADHGAEPSMTELFFRLRAWWNDEEQPNSDIHGFHVFLGITAEKAKELLAWCEDKGLLVKKWPSYDLTALGKSVPQVSGRTIDELLSDEHCAAHVDGGDIIWWTGEASIMVGASGNSLQFLLRWNRNVGHDFRVATDVHEFVRSGGEDRAALRKLFQVFRKDVETVIGGIPGPAYATPGSDPSFGWWTIWLENLRTGFEELLEHLGTQSNIDRGL